MRGQRCERTIRRIVLNPKNGLFAGHDAGAVNGAIIAARIATCKRNGVGPYAWMASMLKAIVGGHTQGQIDDLLPWTDAAKVGWGQRLETSASLAAFGVADHGSELPRTIKPREMWLRTSQIIPTPGTKDRHVIAMTIPISV